MKNKKGFTLIELLAVIVILAIIALIAVPIIMNILNKARQGAAINSAHSYVKALTLHNAMADIERSDKKYFSGEYDVTEINLDNIKGTKPSEGKIIVKNGQIEDGTYLCINNFTLLYKEQNFSVIDNKCSGAQAYYESIIMLDVARRYYTVDEIKQYIDLLATKKNSTLQVHFTDDENVGIELAFLDQTVENATYSNGVYTNPVTGKNFLSYDQVKEIIKYAKSKNVEFVPEIDVPAHMNGFFELAINKYGEDYVRNPYNWDEPSLSGIAPGTGDEAGNIDLMAPNAKIFIKNIYDEYTEFFKAQGCKYFHIGFDEYTYRPELKKDYINELYNYLSKKDFIVRMWSDALTKDNISEINKNIEVIYWSYRDGAEYATVPDLQERGFKVVVGNPYYLFFVPSTDSTTEDSLNYAINNIKENWSLEQWQYKENSSLDSKTNIIGAIISVWGEDSESISSEVIYNQVEKLFNAMNSKLEF